jgi:hypothetical protein
LEIILFVLPILSWCRSDLTAFISLPFEYDQISESGTRLCLNRPPSPQTKRQCKHVARQSTNRDDDDDDKSPEAQTAFSFLNLKAHPLCKSTGQHRGLWTFYERGPAASDFSRIIQRFVESWRRIRRDSLHNGAGANLLIRILVSVREFKVLFRPLA